MDIQIDAFNAEQDSESIKRLWLEIGWLRDDSETERDVLANNLSLGHVRVARVDGETESVAIGADATLQYLDSELPMSGVTAVATGNAARKLGLAGRVTARLVADMAANGAAVSMLGIFDQGYYDRLGFGSGSYDHRVAFQPQDLRVAIPARRPCRLTSANFEEMHACLTTRMKQHGFVTFCSPKVVRAETIRSNRFGFGFRDDESGELTHFLWCNADDLEEGPYHVDAMAYKSHDQFMELLGFLKSLEDQVRLVTLHEPPDIQLQDLVSRPFSRLATLREGKFGTGIRTFAQWQARICDLTACIDKVKLACEPLSFNLNLTDPITEHLDDSRPWRGIAGEYVVTLGPKSHVERASSPSLPTLVASVGAFTRVWLGVRTASGLATTDQLESPPELLAKLDYALRLPKPAWDWRF